MEHIAVNQTPQLQIPLNKLSVAPENSRKTDITARQDELKASLTAYGLLQPLLIRPADKKGHFLVVDGQRRLLALKALVKDKALKNTYVVKCEQINPNIAEEVSLTANIQSETMHPADQFEAFYAMNQNKISTSDIAARFGVSEKSVKQRLKLASVSPKLLQQYRDQEMSLEHLEAFTVSSDHKKQLAVWEGLSSWQKNAHHIKAVLTEENVRSDDFRVEFVTLEAYKKAGGHAEGDLFSEYSYLTDLELLETLVRDKLIEVGKDVETEGWAFVEISPKYEYEYEFVQQYDRVYPKSVELGKEDTARLESVEAEINQIHEEYDEAEDTIELDKKMNKLEIEHEVLLEKMEMFTEEQKSGAGAYVSLHRGGLDITRGLIEKQASKSEKKPKKQISDKLMEHLTSYKTLALRDKLSKSPETAFDLMLTELAQDMLSLPSFSHYSCFKFSSSSTSYYPHQENVESNKTFIEREKNAQQWEKSLASKLDDETNLYDVVSSLDMDKKMELFAFCFSYTVDAIKRPKEEQSLQKHKASDWLSDILKLDMNEYWNATSKLYFSHITKDNILNVIRETKGIEVADSLKKFKKFDLAEAAEKRLAKDNWLPEPLHNGIHKPETE